MEDEHKDTTIVWALTLAPVLLFILLGIVFGWINAVLIMLSIPTYAVLLIGASYILAKIGRAIYLGFIEGWRDAKTK